MASTIKSTVTAGFIILLSSWMYYICKFLSYNYIPEVLDDFCWGTDIQCNEDTNVYPFKINVHKNLTDDLLSKLKTTRAFTPPLQGTQNQYGLNYQVIQKILNFIQTDYNFTERQNFLNHLPQFTTKIQGLDIHFVYIKSKANKSVPTIPMLLLHGWPSSVREFYNFIPLLESENIQDKINVDLVIPSLPGFGYSDGSSKPGFRVAHVANVMKHLMNRLGYNKFLVHGSDWGAITIIALATIYPDSVLALHSNFCVSLRYVTLAKMFLGAVWPRLVVESKYEHKLYPLGENLIRYYFAESGYFHLMGTKPDTIGHILDNTPVGLILFMFEKLSVGKRKTNTFSETAGIEQFDLTTVVDTILFYYWFPKKAATSARFYCENAGIDGLLEGVLNIPVNESVPCACTFFEDDFLYQPENFLRDKFPNLVQHNKYPAIGHFAAIEDNDTLFKDIFLFINKLYESKLI